MKALSLLSFVIIAAAATPEAAIPYFTNMREVRVAQPDRQNFLIVDK